MPSIIYDGKIFIFFITFFLLHWKYFPFYAHSMFFFQNIMLMHYSKTCPSILFIVVFLVSNRITWWSLFYFSLDSNLKILLFMNNSWVNIHSPPRMWKILLWFSNLSLFFTITTLHVRQLLSCVQQWSCK